MDSREKITEALVSLGRSLSDFGRERVTHSVMTQACSANPWFTETDITKAIEEIRENMLDREKLSRWLSAYRPSDIPRNILVIMAGNIPLVGFFDMLCVVASGNRCWYKPSTKDRILMNYIDMLATVSDNPLPVREYREGDVPDAVIATGSDNTNRYFRSIYRGIPSLLRGNRSSAAVISPDDTDEDIRKLASDIFSYSGLGCRNVSHLLIPAGYDIGKLASLLGEYRDVHPGYRNNYRQRSAMLRVQDIPFTDGGYFVLRESDEIPTYISEVTYGYYEDTAVLRKWIDSSSGRLQCVVCNQAGPLPDTVPTVGFGRSQSPTLWDYADNIDTMRFLSSLRQPE